MHMELYEKLLKPIHEVKYLQAENVERYRVIIRYFFHEHENIHYWMFKEDVFEMMKALPKFSEYTMENCQNDLQTLSEWGNLTAMQDSSNIRTLEDYKNKKFRYQLSEYTVVIERMTIELENLEIEGASLEPTLLERIKHQIIQLLVMKEQQPLEVAGWWRALNDDFIRLNQDYQDYIKTLNSAKAEKMMKSREFLVFKDKLITYLRTFVKNLQEQGMMIENYIKDVAKEDLQIIFDKVCEYELSIPRIDSHIKKEDIMKKCIGRWKSLYNWFVGFDGYNEVDRLNDITNEIIRKVTRYALQIGELHNQGANRKEEYRNISDIFAKCESLEEAHKMSAFVFGVDTCIHLKNIAQRDTDSIHSGVYEEAPTYLNLEPRTRVVRNKTKRIPAEDYSFERKIQRMEVEAKLEQERKSIDQLTNDQKIEFSKLPKIDANTRKVLLSWLSRGLANKNKTAKTDQGVYYHIEKADNQMCMLRCVDGDLQMPNFVIVFDEVKV